MTNHYIPNRAKTAGTFFIGYGAGYVYDIDRAIICGISALEIAYYLSIFFKSSISCRVVFKSFYVCSVMSIIFFSYFFLIICIFYSPDLNLPSSQ
jgi:hypothetical protein